MVWCGVLSLNLGGGQDQCETNTQKHHNQSSPAADRKLLHPFLQQALCHCQYILQVLLGLKHVKL